MPFEKGKGCRGRKVVTPEDVFQYPGKTMRYWEIQTKLVGKNKDEIYIDFDQKDGSGEKVVAKLNEKRRSCSRPGRFGNGDEARVSFRDELRCVRYV